MNARHAVMVGFRGATFWNRGKCVCRRSVMLGIAAVLAPLPALATTVKVPTTGPGTIGSDRPLVIMLGFDQCEPCHRWMNNVQPFWEKSPQSKRVDLRAIMAARPSEVAHPGDWRSSEDRSYGWVFKLFQAEYARWTSHDKQDGYEIKDNLAPRFFLVYQGQIQEAAVGPSGWSNYILPKLYQLGFG